MLTTADGSVLVAADPDRDQVYFVDPVGMSQLHTRKLNPGDQPGRVIEDAAGRIHVVLRGGRGIATLGREADSVITRREVCAVPRGIAYDRTRDQLHVACAEGKLVTLTAAPSSTAAVRTLDVGADARDVLVRDDKLFVSRFRAAELLVMNAAGDLLETRTPASSARDETRRSVAETPSASGDPCETKTVHVESTPNVAWRVIDVPQQGVTMLHQRSDTEEIKIQRGGYGAARTCGGGIVQTSMTKGLETNAAATADLSDLTLAVDIATDADGKLLAVVAPGNFGGLPQVQILRLNELFPLYSSSSDGQAPLPGSDGANIAPDVAVTQGQTPCMSGMTLPDPKGQTTAVSFVSAYVLAVQQREPAAISFYDVRNNELRSSVELDDESTADAGHALFHMRAGAGLACASCHPEAGDDGHVWTFETIGPRRTQTLRGGILGTEPLHWNGDMTDFSTLMSEVFVGRMSGFKPSEEQASALSHWIDRQPALHAEAADKAAAERGKLLFESEAVGCATCHTGSHLTNNMTVNVNTGADLQVPSLKGVRFRAPLMHDGCAANLMERLTNPSCGGGDNHGKTSHLTEPELTDLAAYLETL